MPIISEKYLLK